MFANPKENALKIEEMEYEFMDYNRNTRIHLEVYFRATIVVTLGYIIQSAMILAFFYQDLKWMPIWTTIGACVFLIMDSRVSYRLLSIKIRDMRREWKHKKTYVFSANQNQVQTDDTSITMPKMSIVNKKFQIIEDK